MTLRNGAGAPGSLLVGESKTSPIYSMGQEAEGAMRFGKVLLAIGVRDEVS